MIWGWVGVCVVSLAVAYSLAEMCSAYPVAGGQYSWVAILAPKSVARGLSFVCGWFMLIGILAIGAVNNSIVSNFILGMANLSNADYTIERWHAVLVSYFVNAMATIFNIFGPHLFDKISTGVLIWNVSAFVVVVVTILATNDHKQSADFVFREFQNSTGWNPAYTAIIGTVQSAFGVYYHVTNQHCTFV